jgi:V/A-type H+-transporting ATPase subunit C
LSKLKDTDYLSISARVRAMENRLLTRERLERMLEARSNDEAAKVLTECGYGDFGTLSSASLEEELKQSRSVIYQDLRSAVPDSRLIDVFRI